MDSISLEGKKGLILGVRTKRSIAWAITEALHNAGAQFTLSYERDEMKEKIEKLCEGLNGVGFSHLDVTDSASVDKTFEQLKSEYGQLDFLIHSIAYAPFEAFQKPFSEMNADEYNMSHQISAHSLILLSDKALPLMKESGGSIIGMTYLGGERVIPNYNIMGIAKAALECSARYLASELGEHQIRVNTVSAGPIRTPAAKGVPDFMKLYDNVGNVAPLKRNVELREVADTVAFLVSNLSSGITGENIHVDCGYHAMGA